MDKADWKVMSTNEHQQYQSATIGSLSKTFYPWTAQLYSVAVVSHFEKKKINQIKIKLKIISTYPIKFKFKIHNTDLCQNIKIIAVSVHEMRPGIIQGVYLNKRC